jgi:hypothetical protein
MSTYNLIIEKIIGLKNNIFSPNYKSDGVDGIYKVFFDILYNNLNTKSKNKFEFLKETLNNFFFLNKTKEKEEFLNLFYRIQKVYNTINKACYLYKYNKSKLVVETDLALNPINIYDKNVVCIYHINNKYLFKIQDLLKLIYTSLTNSYMFFSEPISIKNPYNNIPFDKSILYYIDYILKTSINIRFIKYNHLDMFLKFKECEFNMTNLVNSYEYVLREYSIQNYINNSTKKTLKDEIFKMIKEFNKKFKSEKKQINISEDFPDNILIKIFKPYIYLKLSYDYSLVNKNKIEAKNKLFKKLVEFQSFNPSFGRKIIKLKYIKKRAGKICSTQKIEFETNHKNFNTYTIDNFMNNHLSYNYESYEIENNDDDEEGEEEDIDINEMPDLVPIYSDTYETNENVVGENIFNFNIITQMYNTQFNNNNNNNNETNEDNENNEYNQYSSSSSSSSDTDDSDNELIEEEYNDNGSIS